MKNDMNNDIEDTFDRGVDHFNLDLYDEAIEYFTTVLELAPGHSDALYYRAIARVNNKDFGNAVSDFTKILEKDPGDADTFIGRGQTFESLGDFKKALSIDPDNPDYQKLVHDLEKRLEHNSKKCDLSQ